MFGDLQYACFLLAFVLHVPLCPQAVLVVDAPNSYTQRAATVYASLSDFTFLRGYPFLPIYPTFR